MKMKGLFGTLAIIIVIVLIVLIYYGIVSLHLI
jgi:hypothetical protein